MKTSILVVGKPKESYIQKGIDEYTKRIQRYSPLSILRLKEEKKANLQAEALAISKEATHLLTEIKPLDTVVALSEEGQLMNSFEWSAFFQDTLATSRGKLVFVIGSGSGLDSTVKERANHLVSLSPLTFPHHLALLLLVEQIYRGWTIVRNEPYHR